MPDERRAYSPQAPDFVNPNLSGPPFELGKKCITFAKSGVDNHVRRSKLAAKAQQ